MPGWMKHLAEEEDYLLTALDRARGDQSAAWAEAIYWEKHTIRIPALDRAIKRILYQKGQAGAEALLVLYPQLFHLWNLLPEELGYEEPYLTLKNLDDYAQWWADVPGELRKIVADMA